MAKITSEDKLLAVIEGHAISGDAKTPAKQGKGKAPGMKGGLARLLKTRILNRFLAVLCIGMTFYFAFDFYYQSAKLKRSFFEIENRKQQKTEVMEDRPILDVNFKESLKWAKKRDMFSLVPPKGKAPVQIKSSTEASDALKKLKVVAIIWAGKDSQVMMEDSEIKQSNLLRIGDSIRGFKIKFIRKSSVVLERDGKEWMVR